MEPSVLADKAFYHGHDGAGRTVGGGISMRLKAEKKSISGIELRGHPDMKQLGGSTSGKVEPGPMAFELCFYAAGDAKSLQGAMRSSRRVKILGTEEAIMNHM